MENKRTSWFMLVVSFFGFLDASFLTIKHFLGSSLTCALFEGCEAVTTSKYSVILGVPVSLLGAVYYLSMLVFVAYYLDSKKVRALSLAAYSTIAGFLATIYFTGLQFFVLKAFCVYCLFSALTSTLLFFAGITLLWKSRRLRDE